MAGLPLHHFEKIDALHTQARAIVSGDLRPWEDARWIASPEHWQFVAQCALDGDTSDLELFLSEHDAELDRQSRFNLPDDESWRDTRDFEAAAEGWAMLEDAA